ncbi:phage portal protein [Defluviitalea raffinosedens]|uniref:Phage portal protein n=1 Tax=Defluviitalea raffinosedens TaxID=1450156 RepID=A0A7C8HEA2_9FIRM|nr:phage portal protein [Defluviitalea raffinosedens]KAE9633726.1 phage portal protein [Defluviitalea raffinosedens]
MKEGEVLITETELINARIAYHAGISLEEFLEEEIKAWKTSEKRQNMIIGKKYYEGEHDILSRQRTVIGKDGQKTPAFNLPNNKIVDNQYSKLVDQKVNYLLSKKPSFKTDNKEYSKILKKLFNNRFLRLLKRIGEDSLNAGIAWMQLYYDKGELKFKRIDPEEILPFWADSDHTELEAVCRIYPVETYEGRQKKTVEKVEYYDTNGVKFYRLENEKLVKEKEGTHFQIAKREKVQGLNWERVPFIAFKYNSKEIPLIQRVKSLQDAINTITCDFMNNMQEDARNTILVLVNYDGTNLGEFRYNLAQYGVVKVKTVDGVAGDLKTLQIEVNSENYKAILDILKKALIENGRGLDAKSDKLGANPNQMNIQSMYSDIDLDANGMENEYQAAFEELLWFVNMHLANTKQGNFTNETVEVVFNRDILINETESIENCSKSTGIISRETIIAQHPWITDPQEELKKLKAEQEEEQEKFNEYRQVFKTVGDKDGVPTE